MAKKFPITDARQTLGFTPATAQRITSDLSTAQGAVGAAVGQGAVQLGEQAIQEKKRQDEQRRRIEEKRQQMTDDNSAVLAQGLRDAESQRIIALKGVSDQKTWEEETARGAADLATQISQLDGSPEFHANQSARSQSYAAVQTAKAFADSTRRLQEDTIDAQTEAMTDSFRSGDTARIAEATRRFADNGANMGKDKAEVLSDIKMSKEAGEKLRKQDSIDNWQDRIAVDPVTAEQQLENELALRKDDKGEISELDSADIQSLLNTATNRKSQIQADTQAAVNKANKELETKLHDDIVSGTASITDIGKSPLPAEAKRRLERDIADVAERDVARTWAIQDSEETVKENNSILTNLEAGQIDINEARSALATQARLKTTDGRSVMSKSTYDKVSTQITNGGRDATDVFVQEQTVQVANFLTGRLTERDAELKVRSQAKTLTALEKRQVKSVGFLLQVERHQLNLYEQSVAARIRELGIEDTSGKEAKVEAVKIWETIKRKDLTRRINDFTSASGQVLVRPTGFTQDVWEDADAGDRAAIVAGVAAGFDNKEIKEMLVK